MTSDDQQMIYVATDPANPATAWAACTGDPRWAEHIAEWERQGAVVLRVTAPEAIKMLNAYRAAHGGNFWSHKKLEGTQ